MALILYLVAFLCAFSHISFAIPPLQSRLIGGFDFHEQKEGAKKELRYRLPPNLRPIHYDLEIRPLLDDDGYGKRFTSVGKVTILTNCTGSTDTIELHTVDTDINVLNVTDQATNEQIPIIGELVKNTTLQNVKITLGSPGLVEGNLYEIYIEFVSLIYQDRNDGLYLTSYIDPSTGESKYLCCTDLEADDARRIFPMFDEPHLKANWTVKIIRKSNYHSLANHEKDGPPQPMPGENGWWRDSYKEVIPMSSYLLAFAVSDFTNETANSTLSRVPVVIWGPPPIMEEGGGLYAANTSALLIQYLEELYDYNYSLPKMDKISLPDFSAGAMENWGLNTYRESRLLFINGTSTIEDKVRMTTTLSHELVHQWFGNLVTMEWWNDLWLNEGFATYFAARGIVEVFPEYNPMEALLINSIQPAMQSDVSSASHPISPERDDVISEADLEGMFSTIVYHKGASILRMTNAFMAGDNMMNGLRAYLKKFDYDTAVQKDLFDCLQEAAAPGTLPEPENENITVNDILETWTTQKGYPVVTVTKTNESTTFEQEPFGLPDAGPSWWIPITYVLKGYSTVDPDTSTKYWLGNESAVVPSPVPTTEWLIVNPTQIGNYRVAYEGTENIELIVQQLLNDDKEIDCMSKSALLDDYFNLGFAKHPQVTITQALDLTVYLSKERHFVPWITFFTNNAQIYRMFGRSSSYMRYRAYLLSLIRPALEEIHYGADYENDTPGGQILLRSRLVEWACNLGEPDCIKFAKEQFAEWMATTDPARNNKINPDLRTTIYCAAMANGGDKEWDFIVARYIDAHNATSSKYLPEVARTSLVRALGCSKQSYRLAKLLDIVMDHQTSFIISPADQLTAIQSVAGNSAGITLAFNFLWDNFATIVRRFPNGLSLVLNTLRTLSNYLNTDLELSDFRAFVASKEELQTPSANASISVSIANIQRNQQWMFDHQASITNWLNNQVW